MRRIASVLAVLILSSLVLVACGDSETEKARQQDIDVRWTLFDRAKQLFPVPSDQIQNFPLREALVKFTVRQDALNHPWFIYLYSMTGEPLGYYVGQTYPQSACNFLSSSEYTSDSHPDSGDDQDNVLTAPSIDGVFYGGGGSSAACESLFFFDATTDAMITFSAPIWVATDVPVSGFTGSALGQTSVDEVTPAPIEENP